MKKSLYALVLLSILSLCCLMGCKGQAAPDYGDTENYELPNVTRIIEPNNDVGYNYLIDNNTGVVYIEYDGTYRHAISVMFNADGTIMTEDDIKKSK